MLPNILSKLSGLTLFPFFLLFGCDEASDKLFTKMHPGHTRVAFSNDLELTNSVNPFTYHNFFNGGGVGVGDINNDGLMDLFFCGNQVPSRLYLNKGNLEFEDITTKAGVSSEGLWYTGVTMADVNGDGLLDIYVCRAADFLVGWRGNELYINNGNNTFSERSFQYGLASSNFSTQSFFFDMDNDGDLDCYLLSNSKFATKYFQQKNQRTVRNPNGGNKLFRNDDNHFVEVTTDAGIYQSSIGFGLGVTISDINKDGWQDIYVSNDFFERDYLYLNNKNGTFTECLEKYIQELSMFSMGADIADINNDGYSDVFVTDMLPEIESRIKSKTTFENWEKYQTNINRGYHRQFLRNVLQLNQGPLVDQKTGKSEFYFSEIGRLSGVCATDWSWGALVTDLDNDGFKDIFVANGISKDITDQDFIQYYSNDSIAANRNRDMKSIVEALPSSPLSNYAFHNNGDLTFENKSSAWGLDDPGFSNGSVYADLDNDGDLEIITSNINAKASIYKNNSSEIHPENKFLKIVLNGDGKNRNGFGAKVTLHYNKTINYQEAIPARGFQSSVDSRLNFGLGNVQNIDSVRIIWPTGKTQLLKNVKPNQILTVNEKDAAGNFYSLIIEKKNLVFESETGTNGLNFIHHEDDFVDFNSDKLTFSMHSKSGPHMAVGDVNKDGKDDVYFCGAKGQPGALYIQSDKGKFGMHMQADFERDSLFEDTDCLFFDADGDKDLDLFVCSGGNIYAENDYLASRLYLNNGKGEFTRDKNALPFIAPLENTSTVSSADYDNDGDIDLFVGGQIKPGAYGYPCHGYILENNGKGIFHDVTSKLAPALQKAGMITDSEWFDFDNDKKPDLVLAGEFMPVTIYHNEGSSFRDVTSAAGTSMTNGWWNRLSIADVNNDGYPDIIALNEGLNTRFKASQTKPVSLFVNDFDKNGTVEQVLCTYNGDKQYPLALRHDLVAPMPFLKKKYLKYSDYKEKTIEDIFTKDQLEGALKLNAYQFQSAVFINNKKGGFEMRTLPVEAQFSCYYAVLAQDFNGDQYVDLLLGGNFFDIKPEIGIEDASYGLLLYGDGSGHFKTVPYSESNLLIKGAVRDIASLKIADRQCILFAKNNDTLKIVSPVKPNLPNR